MASRWLAMICAFQTRAMDMKLMEITQNMRTRPTLDSWAGMLKTRRSQAIVRVLLVLGSISQPSFARIRAGSARECGVCPTISGQSGGQDLTDGPNLLCHGK